MEERKICGAKTRSGNPCQNPPVEGAKRCRMHGGTTPSGTASPHFKTGRYSKHLPKHFAARYEQALTDPDLISLNDEIALTTVRIADLVEQYANETEGVSWADIETAIDLRRRLCTAQSSHLVDANLIITADRAYMMMLMVQEVILRNVHDAASRARIAFELRRIFGSEQQLEGVIHHEHRAISEMGE